MKELSNRNKEFLPFLLPENRGTFTIEDVIKKEDGIENAHFCKTLPFPGKSS